jgi:hypothetical protein
MVWDPTRITAKPWPLALQLYRHLEDRNDDFRPLRRLVEHAASAPYGSSIFAATSGTALLVAREADANWTRDALRIDVGLSGSIRFVLPQERPGKSATFECEGEDVIEAFESRLRDAGWV